MRHIAPSQMLLMPSNWEGFALAAGEAVCLGCSIVGTPIGSLEYLVGDGERGTIADSFDTSAVLDALKAEAARWERGERNPARIAATWRGRINRRAVGGALLELLDGIVEAA